MRADPDNQRILGVPVNGLFEMEVAGGKAAGVLTKRLAVEPHRGAELGLVDLEQTHRVLPGRPERPLIPEVVAVLVDLTRPIIGQPILGREFGPDSVRQVFTAVKCIHVRKSRCREVGQSWHRHAVGERGGSLRG